MLEVIKNRRSLRKFNSDEIKKEDLITICEAGLMAPSARNQNSKAFIVVEDKELLNKLSLISPGAKILEGANKAICVICPNVNELLTPDMVLEDLGAATENVLLEATNLKIGSCWIGIAPNQDRMIKGSDILELPEEAFLFAIVALGYPESDNAFYQKDKINLDLIKFL